MPDDLTLNSGEHQLWAGAPVRRPFFEAADLVTLPFSLLWLAFVVFWLTGTRSIGAPLLFVLWGGVFVLIGLYSSVGRLIVRAMRLRATSYIVTDQRLIEKTGGPWNQTREAYLRSLPPPVVRVRDGETIGTVAFGQLPGLREAFDDAGIRPRGRPRPPRPFVLRHIDPARYVRDLLADAMTKANAQSGPTDQSGRTERWWPF